MALLIQSPSATYTRTGLFSAWMPSNLAAGLIGWWRADAGATLDGSNRVTSLLDQSGQNMNLAPGGSGGPLSVAAAQNNKPGFYNDTAVATARYLSAAYGVNQASPFSIAIAFRKGTLGNTYDQIVGNLDANGFTSGWALASGFEMGGGSGNVPAGFGIASSRSGTNMIGAIVKGSTNLNVGSNYIVIGSYDGSAVVGGLKLYVNGNAETLTTASNSLANFSNSSPFVLGSSFAGQSPGHEYFEACLLNRAVTASEVTSLFKYLNQRWAIY